MSFVLRATQSYSACARFGCVKTTTFTDILLGLEEFFELCKALDLRVEAGRFGIYRSRIDQLIHEIKRLQGGKDTMTIYRKLATELPRYLVALAESQEVGGFVPFLRARPAEEVIPSIRRVIAGPELPSEEEHSSNQARNIQFELFLAATLWQCGVQVELAEPDLRCKIGDLTILFACKRLFAQNRLNKRINEATKQLRRNLESLPPKTSAGIIAISLSRVIGTIEQAVRITNQQEGLEHLAAAINALAMHRAKWRRTREAEGIIFHLTSIFNNEETNRLEPGSFMTLFGDGPACQALAVKLQNAADTRRNAESGVA